MGVTGHQDLTGTALRQLVLDQRAAIANCAAGCGVGGLLLFGSVARGTATMTSDIDVFVMLPGPPELGGPLHLSQCLERILGRRVHVTTADCGDPALVQRIHAYGIPLDGFADAANRDRGHAS
jgi:predicted nucleotidyltransferase